MLGAFGAAAAVLGVGGRAIARTRFSAAKSRKNVTVPTAEEPLAALPAGVEVDVAEMPPFITPNDDFYRIDTALEVPQLSTSGYTLTVKGLVDNELVLTWQDLLNRPMIERDVTLTCVSNNVGGHYIGNARWIGARLDDLLREAGPRDGADMVVGRSVDGYECGFPLENALDGRDAMIAVAMNGEPLPLEHGFPARLVVPGLYGYVSATKWLTEIELTRFDDFEHYWEQRGWAEKAPIKLQSRIDVPKGLARVPAGGVAVAGVAWAQQVGVAASRSRSTTATGSKRSSPTRTRSTRGGNGCTAGTPRPAGTRSRCGRPTRTATCRPASAPSRSPTARPATTRSSSSSSRSFRHRASSEPRSGALLRSRRASWGIGLDDEFSTPSSTTAVRTSEKGHPMRTRRTRLAAIAAVAALGTAVAASVATASEGAFSTRPAAAPVGAGCADIPTEGEASIAGMADDRAATAAANNPTCRRSSAPSTRPD